MFKDDFAAYSVLLAKSSVALTWAIFVPLKTHGLKVVRLSLVVYVFSSFKLQRTAVLTNWVINTITRPHFDQAMQ